MMVLVRFIDVFVIFCKILGGRGYGNPFTRVLAWLVVVSVAIVAVGFVAYLVTHIPDFVESLNS